MTTHQETHPRARRGGPFLARSEIVGGLAALLLGMLISQGVPEGVTLTGIIAIGVGALFGRCGATWGRTAVVAGIRFHLGPLPSRRVTVVVIVAAYGF